MLNNRSLFGINVVLLNPNVDKISLSLFDPSSSCHEDIYKQADKYPDEKDIDKKNPYYDKKSNFMIDGKRVFLKRNTITLDLSLVLCQPTKELQDILNKIFKKHTTIRPCLNGFELAFDHYVNSRDEAVLLQKKMIHQIIQTYQHGIIKPEVNPKDSSITFYTTEIVKGKKRKRRSKFGKVYIRPFEGQKSDKGILPLFFVRLELTFNRSILKDKLRWGFPISQEAIRDLSIYKYIRFCGYNFKKFEKFIVKSKPNIISKKLEIETRSGLSIKNYCRKIRKEPMYEILQFQKTIPDLGHHRFIDDLFCADENLLLQEAVYEMQGYDIKLNRPVPFTDISRFKELIARRKLLSVQLQNENVLNTTSGAIESDYSLDSLPY